MKQEQAVDVERKGVGRVRRDAEQVTHRIVVFPVGETAQRHRARRQRIRGRARITTRNADDGTATADAGRASTANHARASTCSRVTGITRLEPTIATRDVGSTSAYTQCENDYGA